MRKYNPKIGRGPRVGSVKKREVKSLTMMSNLELSQLRIRAREKNKVFKEMDKRGLSHDKVEVIRL